MRFLILLSLFAYSGAVIQEIVLHESFDDNDGNSYIFRRGVPDLTIYPFLDDIVRFCHNTRMQLYSNVNYEGNVNGTLDTSGCSDLDTVEYKSFRFFGNADTTKDAVSLFPESQLRGEEILVDRSPFGGITQQIASVAYSGLSSWTIFEGANFNGRTSCLPAGSDENTVAYYTLDALGISSIGSLFKGCSTRITPEFRAELRKLAYRHH